MSCEEVLRDPAIFQRCDLALRRAIGISTAPHWFEDDGDVGKVPDTCDTSHATRCAALPDTNGPTLLGLAEEYLQLCMQQPPSTVWYRSGEGPCDVIRRHFGWMLTHSSANELLEQQAYRKPVKGVRALEQLIATSLKGVRAARRRDRRPLKVVQ
eukprot:SAG31_NODE_1620_length_7725_cov_1.520850_7_plen_155_part_00